MKKDLNLMIVVLVRNLALKAKNPVRVEMRHQKMSISSIKSLHSVSAKSKTSPPAIRTTRMAPAIRVITSH
jgi:hypothetical protein